MKNFLVVIATAFILLGIFGLCYFDIYVQTHEDEDVCEVPLKSAKYADNPKESVYDRKIAEVADSLIKHEMFMDQDEATTQAFRDSLLHYLNEKYLNQP